MRAINNKMRFVDEQGRLTAEGFNALQPSLTVPYTSPVTALFVSDVVGVAYLPSPQTVTLTRNGVNVVLPSQPSVLLNPGDKIAFGAAISINFVPL